VAHRGRGQGTTAVLYCAGEAAGAALGEMRRLRGIGVRGGGLGHWEKGRSEGGRGFIK
jgi:hypothetical protein